MRNAWARVWSALTGRNVSYRRSSGNAAVQQVIRWNVEQGRIRRMA
jgi:hypothetical protein